MFYIPDRKGAEESGLDHYNTALVGHFIAFNSKPTISIWEEKKRFLELIYLHVLLSRGKELIMNDLSIVFPQMVRGRASAEAQHISRARSPGPDS